MSDEKTEIEKIRLQAVRYLREHPEERDAIKGVIDALFAGSIDLGEAKNMVITLADQQAADPSHFGTSEAVRRTRKKMLRDYYAFGARDVWTNNLKKLVYKTIERDELLRKQVARDFSFTGAMEVSILYGRQMYASNPTFERVGATVDEVDAMILWAKFASL
jgi:hypothetical protein